MKKILCLIVASFLIISNAFIFTACNDKCAHVYEFSCSEKCSLCQKVRTDGESHEYLNYNSCESNTCTRCNYHLVQDHSWQYDQLVLATLNHVGGQREICEKCQKTRLIDETPIIDPLSLDMPVVYIEDIDDTAIPLAQLEKNDGEISVKYKYVSLNASDSFEGYSKIKIQGSSSSAYPKKNFTIKLYSDDTFDNKLKVNLGWGEQNKYCMKANYIDSSHARNIVGARLFSQIVDSRYHVNEGLFLAPNYGVIDGYPVLTYLNGEFYGIYTMNIPKDEWMFAMDGDENSKEALLMSDGWTTSNRLEQTIDGDFEDSCFEVEYSSTDDEEWIKDSFNDLITILNSNENDIINNLDKYLDIEAAIDVMIFSYFLNASDNLAKNMLWATYDGTTWIPTMYDMDSTFGIFWTGEAQPNHLSPWRTFDGEYVSDANKLFDVLLNYFTSDVKQRYSNLRGTVLGDENIRVEIGSFSSSINKLAFISESEKWVDIPYAEDNRTNLYTCALEQLDVIDDFFLYTLG